jgi:hypothetical protein
MRIGPAGILLLALLAGACSHHDRRELVPVTRHTPQASFALLRAAILTDRPDLVYESLSEGYKDRFGVPGRREFNVGWRNLGSDLDRMKRVFERTRVVRIGYTEHEGVRFAVLDVSAADMEGQLLMVDRPTLGLLVEIPGYDPETAESGLPGSDFSSVLDVADGMITFRVNGADLGVASASEVHGLHLRHDWLLEDHRLPVDVGEIVRRINQAATTN